MSGIDHCHRFNPVFCAGGKYRDFRLSANQFFLSVLSGPIAVPGMPVGTDKFAADQFLFGLIAFFAMPVGFPFSLGTDQHSVFRKACLTVRMTFRFLSFTDQDPNRFIAFIRMPVGFRFFQSADRISVLIQAEFVMGMVIDIFRVSAGQFTLRIAAAAVMMDVKPGNILPSDFRHRFFLFLAANQNPLITFRRANMFFRFLPEGHSSFLFCDGRRASGGQHRQCGRH